MYRHPTQGVKGAKPRFPSVKDNGKPTKAEVSALSAEYLESRNRQMHAKAFMAETSAAAARGELISKDLVTRPAAYLLVAVRQNILNLPAAYARRPVGLRDANAVKKMLQEMAISVLNNLKNLPQQVTDANWLAELESDDEPSKR
jgi:hypothetical protein